MTNSNNSELTQLRDNSRSYEAYSRQMGEARQSICDTKQDLSENDYERPSSLRNLVFMDYLEIAKVMYCRGDEFADIQRPIVEAIEYVLQIEQHSIVKAIYTKVLDVASLLVLLKMPKEVFNKLKVVVDRCDARDLVLDHLLAHGTVFKPGEAGRAPIMLHEGLESTVECCEASEMGCEKHLMGYLNNVWHGGLSVSRDFKNRDNPELPYKGIYCFPVAAMAHVNNLDDSELRKSPYYPIEIADYARSR